MKKLSMNEAYEGWIAGKGNLKDITFYKYTYMYEKFIAPYFGERKLDSLKRKDFSDYYAFLAEKRRLKPGTIRNYHNIIRQILQYAVDEEYLKKNPSDGAWVAVDKKNWLKISKRHALSSEEQTSLLQFLNEDERYHRWFPSVQTLLGTGMRVGEFTGLRWCDVDLESGIIDINHNLGRVFRKEPGSSQNGGREEYHYHLYVDSPKTLDSRRRIPLLSSVRNALEMEREMQAEEGVHCRVEIDGYTDFIFLNSAGGVQTADALNKMFDRIRKSHNEQKRGIILPRFSCHTMRHTFATRLYESGLSMKTIQALMGHSDIKITMNIYAEATESYKKEEMEKLEKMFNNLDK